MTRLGIEQKLDYDNMCKPCFEDQLAKVAKFPEVKQWAAQLYIYQGAARTALLTAGVPSVELYEIKLEVKRGSWKDQLVEVATPIGRGWMLGEFKWVFSYSQGFPNGDLKRYELKDCLTALRDIPEISSGPVAVYPHSGGYALHMVNRERVADDNWIPLMLAVKRLAGLPTP